MLGGVKGTLTFWPISPHSRKQLGKRSVHKTCSKESHLNYLFHKLSSHMKDCQDNEAVWFGFEFTSYIVARVRAYIGMIELIKKY
jgi:hypothetical protein